MPTEQELISRTPQPATRASLARQMRENGLTLGGTVLVHSSLSSLGWVAGGPVAVIQELIRYAEITSLSLQIYLSLFSP